MVGSTEDCLLLSAGPSATSCAVCHPFDSFYTSSHHNISIRFHTALCTNRPITKYCTYIVLLQHPAHSILSPLQQPFSPCSGRLSFLASLSSGSGSTSPTFGSGIDAGFFHTSTKLFSGFTKLVSGFAIGFSVNKIWLQVAPAQHWPQFNTGCRKLTSKTFISTLGSSELMMVGSSNSVKICGLDSGDSMSVWALYAPLLLA